MNRIPQARSSLLAAALLAFMGRPAESQTNYYWDAWDPADVDFHTPAHWDPAGPPGEGDNVFFNQADTNRVEFGQSVTNRHARVQDAIASGGVDISVDLGGQTWTLTATGSGGTDSGLLVGNNRAGTMQVTNGVLAVGTAVIGSANLSDGTLRLSGSNTVMTSSGRVYVSFNSGSRGTLVIEDGAQAFLDSLFTYRYSTTENTSGHVLVTGTNSHLATADSTGIHSRSGGEQTSTLTFADGATGLLAALNVGADAVMTVAGKDTVVTQHLGRMLLAGGELVVKEEGRFVDDGTHASRVYGGHALTVESGGTFIAGTTMLLGYADNSEGTIIVRDQGSRFETAATRDLNVASPNVGAHVTGRLLVHTGGVASARDLYVADGDATRTGIVAVAGSGARVEARHMYLGGEDEAFGRAEVSVSAGGVLEATGTLRAWDDAELTLDGGTVVADTLDMKTNATLKVALHAAQIGATLIDVTGGGKAIIEDAVLEVSLASGYNPGGEDVFTLINTDWNGFFKDGDGNPLTDGAVVWGEETGVHVVLNYVDNNNYSITLTAIPEPGALALLGLAGILLLKRRFG